MTKAAIGFRVKTGRAIAVLLVGPVPSPTVLERREVQLWDPRVPDSRQPYHPALDLPADEGDAVVRKARRAVRGVANRVVEELIEELRTVGHDPVGIGLVVGSITDPSKLGNPHVRAHASEGRLFHEVLADAAAKCHVPSLTLVERDAYDDAEAALGRSADALKRATTELGKVVGRPWRADEKTAALAAWVALGRKR